MVRSSTMAPAVLDNTPDSVPDKILIQKGIDSPSPDRNPRKSPSYSECPASSHNGATIDPLTSGIKASSYPQSGISLVNRFIDEPRSLRVSVIGGGLAGILAGILLPKKVPGIQLTIYEKNKDFVSRLSGVSRTR